MGTSGLDASVSVDGVNLVVKHPNLTKFRPFNHVREHDFIISENKMLFLLPLSCLKLSTLMYTKAKQS